MQDEYKDGIADLRAKWPDGPVKVIDRPDILNFRDKVARQWAPSRVNKAIKTLRRLLNYSIDRGYVLTYNPAEKVPKMKTGDGKG